MLVVAEREQLPVQQARAGDAEAWNALLRRYQLPLYVYVIELVHNEQASLDIVQETFVNAVRHLDSLRDDEKFGSWLFGIAHQKCIQQWRRQNRDAELQEELADAPAGANNTPLDLLIREEQEGEFMKLLNQLPPPQRAVLLLHFMEDFSLEEIAHVTGTPLGTVKSRLYYAKRALRKLLEEESS
ncbi:MAG: RNA polymerase sigma factor [Verrucomicrobiia bacterium]